MSMGFFIDFLLNRPEISKHTFYDEVTITYTWRKSARENEYECKRFEKDYIRHEIQPRLKDYTNSTKEGGCWIFREGSILGKYFLPEDKIQGQLLMIKLIWSTDDSIFNNFRVGDVFVLDNNPLYVWTDVCFTDTIVKNKEKFDATLEEAKHYLFNAVEKVKIQTDKQRTSGVIKHIMVTEDEFGRKLSKPFQYFY